MLSGTKETGGQGAWGWGERVPQRTHWPCLGKTLQLEGLKMWESVAGEGIPLFEGVCRQITYSPSIPAFGTLLHRLCRRGARIRVPCQVLAACSRQDPTVVSVVPGYLPGAAGCWQRRQHRGKQVLRAKPEVKFIKTHPKCKNSSWEPQAPPLRTRSEIIIH